MNDALQVAAALGILFVVGRWLFSSGGNDNANAGGQNVANHQRRRRYRNGDVEQVVSMFPQTSVAAARYDLERSGSLNVTIERALRDGYLTEPPAGYYPDLVVTASTSSIATLEAPKRSTANETPSLITRLGLQSRVEDDWDRPVDDIGKGKGKATSWANTAEDREKSLRERKAKMVLEARRKLLEKERAAKANSASS